MKDRQQERFQEIKLTIFTPTYNRAKLLQRLYQSLCCQTCRNFLWLVVDDGSTDDTPALLRRWQEENVFPLQWKRTVNQGKHRAYNLAVSLSDTALFFCVDSDDLLYPDAVFRILSHWEQFGNEHLAGIIGYRTDLYGRRQGSFYTDKAAFLRNLYQKGLVGDTALIYRTSLLKDYPFPVFPDEYFITENTVYMEIDRKCPLLPLKYPLTKGGYQSDGYTKNAIRLLRDNPKGWAYYHYKKATYAESCSERIYHLCQYKAYCILSGQTALEDMAVPILYRFPALLIGWLLSRKRKLQYRRHEKQEARL